MKIAVIGAGAIGGLLAARLASSGAAEVTVLARGRNLTALRGRGLELRAPDAEPLVVKNLRVAATAEEAGPQDHVMLAVKAHQVADLLPGLPAMLGPQTSVVSMVNGVPWWYFQRHGAEHEGRIVQSVDPGGHIAAAIPAERVIGGIVYPAAQLLEPGVVQWLDGNRFTLGEPDGSRSPRVEALAQALIAAGLRAPISRDLRGEIWVKLLGNLSFNPVSALTRATLEQICLFGPTRQLIAQMMTEAQAVAAALGVALKVSIEQRIAGAQAVGAHKTSMLQDIEAGRPPELEALLGAVIELGDVAGVPTPLLRAVYAACALLARTSAPT